MKISIAMTTYNGMGYIKEQLDSLKSQSKKADEVVIIDDASTDGTFEYVREYIEACSLSGWEILKNEERLGYICNFAKALGMCQGDIIFTCDQDDIWHQNKLEKMSEIMDADDSVKLLASSLEFIDENGSLIDKEYIPYNMNGTEEKALVKIGFLQILEKNFFPGCTMAVRKEIVERYCGNNDKEIAHDWLMAMLAAEEDGLVWYNSRLISYRIHSGNTVGLLAAKAGKLNYIRQTIGTWKGYCTELNRRIEYAKKNMDVSDEYKASFAQICRINASRRIIVLRQDNEGSGIPTVHGYGVMERLKSFLSEVKIYASSKKKVFDVRGLAIDFIYVFKRSGA